MAQKYNFNKEKKSLETIKEGYKYAAIADSSNERHIQGFAFSLNSEDHFEFEGYFHDNGECLFILPNSLEKCPTMAARSRNIMRRLYRALGMKVGMLEGRTIYS